MKSIALAGALFVLLLHSSDIFRIARHAATVRQNTLSLTN
jgi:hypothetical protein